MLSLAFCILMSLIIGLIFNLFCFVVLLRAWMFAVRIPAFTPALHTIYKLTNWLVLPLQKVFQPHGKIDTASVVAAYLVCLVQIILLLFVLLGNYALHMLLSALLMAVLMLASNILDLIFWMTIIYAVMSWVSPTSPQMMLMRSLLEPLLAPVRKLPFMNKLRGIDLSPLVVIIVSKLLSGLLAGSSYSMAASGAF